MRFGTWLLTRTSRTSVALLASAALLPSGAVLAQSAPAAGSVAVPAAESTAAPESGADAASAVPGNRLIITDVRKGSGPAIAAGQTAVVQYTGWLYAPDAPDHKGRKFDSSRDRNAPFSFFVGGGDVILGWDRGVVGMQAGGERRLIVPPAFGYGARGAGNDIPPNATLLFEIELLAIR